MYINLGSSFFPTLISAFFAVVLVAGVPALSYSTARNSEVLAMPRLTLYRSAVFSQWALTLLGFGVVLLATREVFKGFAAIALFALLAWGAGIAAMTLLALGTV